MDAAVTTRGSDFPVQRMAEDLDETVGRKVMNERHVIQAFWTGTCIWAVCDDGTMWQGFWNGFKHEWRRVEGPPKDTEEEKK